MSANEPFFGLYSLRLRAILPSLSGQELKVFTALGTYVNDMGTCWPGVRELSIVTTFPTDIVSGLLNSLEKKCLVVTLRRSQRDPFTGRMLADVYALSPDILLVLNPTAWNEFMFRHASMPESLFPRDTAQPDRITEPESGNQKQEPEPQHPEGAAALSNANPMDVATRRWQTTRPNGGTSSTAGSESRTDSAQRHTHPPGSAPSPFRPLTFQEGVVANAIRRQLPELSADKACELIVLYGTDRVSAAVDSLMSRQRKTEIKRPVGWLIRNLQSGAKYR